MLSVVVIGKVKGDVASNLSIPPTIGGGPNSTVDGLGGFDPVEKTLMSEWSNWPRSFPGDL
jgi:hypothetical protein